MQLPPLNFSDLSILLALGAIILLLTAELASPSIRLNKPYHKQEKTAKRSPNNGFTIPSNRCHQNSKHNHRPLKHLTKPPANFSTFNREDPAQNTVASLKIFVTLPLVGCDYTKQIFSAPKNFNYIQ